MSDSESEDVVERLQHGAWLRMRTEHGGGDYESLEIWRVRDGFRVITERVYADSTMPFSRVDNDDWDRDGVKNLLRDLDYGAVLSALGGGAGPGSGR
jgi:hypothetical protein